MRNTLIYDRELRPADSHVDWREALVGKPSWRLSQAASGWNCCAVGQLTRRLPREGTVPEWRAAPKDKQLSSLGVQFTRAVALDKYPEALVILNKIEARALVVLNKNPITDLKKKLVIGAVLTSIAFAFHFFVPASREQVPLGAVTQAWAASKE